MEEERFFVKDLEKHQTKDVKDSHINGRLDVIWRDWDKIIKNHPKMIYVSSINPGEVKGPHIHKIRTSYLVCIHGKVVFIVDKGNNDYKEIEADSEKPVLICVPNGIFIPAPQHVLSSVFASGSKLSAKESVHP